MPIYPDNFQANSLSGSVLITDGHANISLTTNPYALEGDKSFVVKLRKGGPSGLVIATSSPVTLRDTSSIVSLTANISSVNEGNLVQFTLITENAVDNSNVYYSVFPATANITTQDFFGANIGKATIVSNQATFALRANADLSLVDETGENFRVQLRTNSPVGNIIYATSNVTILDVSKGFNILSFVESAATVGEGTPITLTFNATNIPVGTVFYWNTDGNATVSTFTEGNTGSFVMNSFSNTITLNPTGVPYSTTQNFNVKLRALSNTGAVVATSNNLIVVDGAIAYINATGGNVATISGYKVHTFTTSGNLTVSSLGAGSGNFVDYLVVAGGGAGSGAPFPQGGGGGGGAGGLISNSFNVTTLGNTTIVIGAGGVNSPAPANGSNTTISGTDVGTLIAVGGGYGAPGGGNGNPGGSGGGAWFGGSVGAGYLFPSPNQQGYPGGAGIAQGGYGGGGGGGAGQSGYAGTISPITSAGNGGNGIYSLISGSNVAYGGGGGGGGRTASGETLSIGGAGGGGAGGGSNPAPGASVTGAAGNVNTGGGGGGGGPAGGIGGSGVVIIRYPFVPSPTVSNVVTSSNVFIVGSNITFTVNAQNANLITLYYSTDGNVDSTYFIGGNTGSFIANASGGIVALLGNISATVPVGQTRNFRLQIRQDSTTGFISGSSANVALVASADYYMQATGGDISIANGYKTHIFTQSGNLTVTGLGLTSSTSNAEILVVAGGGGGGDQNGGGGGGAGGLLYGNINLALQNYMVIIGGGGSFNATGVRPGYGPNHEGYQGSPTTLSPSIVAIGGGGGSGTYGLGTSGGSGGGGAAYYTESSPGIQGPSGGLTGYGNRGSPGPANGGSGGGGGALGVGQLAFNNASGGAGFPSSISGSSQIYAAGGGLTTITQGAAVANTGKGGSNNPAGQNGSPGIVIIRYPYS